MSVFQNGILRFAWLASLVVALGTKRNGTGLVLLQPEPKAVESVPQLDAFKFDAMPIVPEEVLSQDQLAKTYHNPGTMRKIKTPVLPTTRRKIPSMGGLAASKRRLTTQAIATAATKKKVQQDSWRQTQPRIQARGRKEATQYDFDPASSIMQAVGTRRRIGGGQQQTVSKGYVSPTARHVGPGRRDQQTKRQVKPAQSMRVVTTRKTVGAPAPPPPPPSYARKSTRPLQKSVPARPAVLQQTQSPRRILGTSTRRVVAPVKKPAPAPLVTARKPKQSKYISKMPTRREVLRIAEGTEEDSSIEEIVPAKTRRAAVKKPAAYAKPQKGKKKPVKAATLSSTEVTSTSDLTEAEDSSSIEPPMQTRRHGKKPVAAKKNPAARKHVATQRNAVKETATRRKQIKAEPAKQKKKKAVAVVESDSDESTSSDSFERQFTRRQVLKAKPKKPAAKETKRKARKVVEPSSSSSIEEETTSSQEPSSSVEESPSSSSSEYVQTRRKGKSVQTKRKVQTARKVKKPAAKPAKQPKGRQGKGKKQRKEETVTEESSVLQPPRKQAQTMRRALAPKWKKEEPTTRKAEATKRKAVTKRDAKIKEKARPRGKYVSSETETSAQQSSTIEPSSASYRPTRRQAAVQTKKKLGYGTPTKRRH